MQNYKNVRQKLFLPALFCITFIVSAETAAFETRITMAEVQIQNDNFVLNADVRYQLSPLAEQALQNGIPLSFDVLLILQKSQSWWWQQAIKDIRVHYELRYSILLDVYRIENNSGNEIGRYSSLAGALGGLGRIRNIYIADKQYPFKQAEYNVALQVRFDKEALPLPLRTEAYFSKDWALSSAWLRWEVNLSVLKDNYHAE